MAHYSPDVGLAVRCKSVTEALNPTSFPFCLPLFSYAIRKKQPKRMFSECWPLHLRGAVRPKRLNVAKSGAVSMHGGTFLLQLDDMHAIR